MFWVVIGVLAAWLVVELAIRVIAVTAVLPILERPPPFNVDVATPAPDAEPIEFRTSDGLTLRGNLRVPPGAPPRGLIIFCPELGGEHWSAGDYAQGLLQAGFAVLAFDFRNQGQSDRLAGYAPLHWLTEYEVTDALAAIDYVEQRSDLARLPIGIFGISRGGSAALVAAARRPKVAAAACEGVFSFSTLSLHYAVRWATLYFSPQFMRLFPLWHVRSTLNLSRWISQWRRHCRYTLLETWLPKLSGRPVLMIVDGRDNYVSPEVSEVLFQRFPSSSERWVIATAKHNTGRDVDPAEYDRRLVAFFSKMPCNTDRIPARAE